MFLSKKNANYFNKPKHVDPTKPRRILGGWTDDEDEKGESYEYSKKKDEKDSEPLNLLEQQESIKQSVESCEKNEKKQKFYFNWDELDEKNDIECEKKVVEEIVQPGGIRIKPNDNMLNQFLKQTKGMEVSIIGSLLLSKIQVNYPFQVKAKALYAIEFLIKKNQKYLAYYKAHSDFLRDFPEPEDNVDAYRKILKSLLGVIGVSASSKNPIQEEPKMQFLDPGYNDAPNSVSSFLNKNTNKTKTTEVKRQIIGPGQAKTKVQPDSIKNSNNVTQNLFDLDLLGNNGSKVQHHGNGNLLETQVQETKPKQADLSFEQMFGNLNNTGSQNQTGTFNF